MARRIVRTCVQFTLLSALLAVLVFFLDLRYRVLPPRIHNLLPEHHAGVIITDITYVQCSRILSSCAAPDSSTDWVRLQKDVFLGKGWLQQGYIQVQRKAEKEYDAAKDKIVMDVRMGRLEPKAEEGKGDEGKWEIRPGGMWVKRQTRYSEHGVTAVDLLYGMDAVEVREGWELKENFLTVGDAVKVTVRRGALIKVKKPVVRMRNDHKFKIIQVSDLHLSTGPGACRDAQPASSVAKCEADPRTLSFVEKILDDEKPDLAVLSGDQVNGDTAPDVQSAIFKFAEPFIARQIPYATILGNHDDEGNLSREQIMKITAGLPYSLSEIGPEMGEIIKDKKGRAMHEGGAGNYYVEVLSAKSDHSALTLYFLDTHSYSPDPKKQGYDWVKDYQIDWFRDTSHSLVEPHSKYAFMHLNMAFIHIPLPEYRLSNPMVGERREPPTAPGYNSGFKDALVNAGVSVVSAGHDHANDYCMVDEKEGDLPGLWMCYAGGSGFGGYGGYGGYHRRVRVWEVNGPADRIKTWKRVEYPSDAGPLDLQTIVESGKVVGPAEGGGGLTRREL